jgi:hypothetical protein
MNDEALNAAHPDDRITVLAEMITLLQVAQRLSKQHRHSLAVLSALATTRRYCEDELTQLTGA